MLWIWKPLEHKQPESPQFSYFDKYVFIVRIPPLCLMGILCVCCELFFSQGFFFTTTTTTTVAPWPRSTDAITHVFLAADVGGTPRSRADSTHEGKGVPLPSCAESALERGVPPPSAARSTCVMASVERGDGAAVVVVKKNPD